MKLEEGRERNRRKKSNHIIHNSPNIKSMHTKPNIPINRGMFGTLQVDVHIMHNDTHSLIDEGEAPYKPATTQISIPSLAMLETNRTWK